MAKTIEFTAEELAALQAFYSKQLQETKERLHSIESIIRKIGTIPKKRGRKPTATKNDINSELKASLSSLTSAPAKKRGRPGKIKTESTAPKRRGRPKKEVKAELISEPKRRGRPSKTSASTPTSSAPKKRGRPSKVSEATTSAKRRGRPAKAVVVSPSAKRRGRPAKVKLASPASKRRGRPAKAKEETVKQASPAKSNSSSKVKTEVAAPKRRGRPAKETKSATSTAKKRQGRPAKAVSIVSTPVKKRGRPSKALTIASESSTTIKTSKNDAKSPRGRKPVSKKIEVQSIDLTPSKEMAAKIEALASKMESVKSITTSSSSSEVVAKKAATKKATPKKVAKEKTASKKKSGPQKAVKMPNNDGKLTYNNFIIDLLNKEERFLSTPEINEAAFETYRTIESEKKKIKSTLQTTLHRLNSDNMIQLRKKDGDKLSYWASSSVSDYGFLPEVK
ncbi:MAG: hypothetical protein WED33_03765 [Bacteroidia bacterium]